MNQIRSYENKPYPIVFFDFVGFLKKCMQIVKIGLKITVFSGFCGSCIKMQDFTAKSYTNGYLAGYTDCQNGDLDNRQVNWLESKRRVK